MSEIDRGYYEIERKRRETAEARIAELENALRELVRSHHGYAMGLGPCICAAHEDARRLLGMTENGDL